MEKIVASVSATGNARIYNEQFMPYDLYLEEEMAENDIDTMMNNLINFYHWCASRVLSLDRKYAKELLNSIGASQAVTDKDRANISLSYHCVSLTDVFWVRKRGETVTESRIVTSKKYSIVSKMAFDVYACNHDIDTLEFCKQLDPVTYYGMNILDYLTGNTDRHPENWGFLVDNETNRCVSLYPLMDFNQCFHAYDTIEGANCQTVLPKRLSQRAAALEAVEHIGLRQKKEMDLELFEDMALEREMFQKRLLNLNRGQ